MQAAFYTQQGLANEVLTVGQQPIPQPQEGEVRVRLRNSGINPSDVKSRAGTLGRELAFPLIIPHSDGAGDIDAVGAGVPVERLGERVWIWNGQWRRPFGTAAQYMVIPAQQAVQLPASIDYAAGACLGIPALTAYHAVEQTGARPGQTILISGGAGAVGNYAIQIAKQKGLRVLTTVSTDAKADFARAAGADEVINYKTDDIGLRVMQMTNGAGVDAIIELDIAMNAPIIPHTLKPHGTVVIYGYSSPAAPLPLQWLLQNSATLRFFLVYELSNKERQAAITGLTALLKENRLMHTVAQRFSLSDIVAAHQAVESGAVMGNVVIDID